MCGLGGGERGGSAAVFRLGYVACLLHRAGVVTAAALCGTLRSRVCLRLLPGERRGPFATAASWWPAGPDPAAPCLWLRTVARIFFLFALARVPCVPGH